MQNSDRNPVLRCRTSASTRRAGLAPTCRIGTSGPTSRASATSSAANLTEFELKGVGGADPQWNNKQATTSATVVFTVQPVGWVGDWHENPAPQWIVVLSGRWWIESMDGTRIEQGPGEFSFGEDQGCTETDGRRAIAPARLARSRRC